MNPMSDSDYKGKVVVVTGAGAGIGRAITEIFVDAGMRVAALDINAASVLELQDKFGRERLLGAHLDITDPKSCKAAIGATLKHFGAVHCLVNNAALGMNAVHPKYDSGKLQIEDCSEDLWQRFMITNACGFYFMCRQAVPHMRKQAWGRIINIGTSYFTMMRPGFSPYGPSKAVMEAHTLMLARELEGSGITVNMVIPGGPADTQMVPDVEGLDRSTLIRPSMMAPPMLGLFSEAASSITGCRFLAVDWKDTIQNPGKQMFRSAGWPELATPLASLPKVG
jgi:NAD(P)-dependent dehydrogenase (short-subunit alcohol dehydrogenase family)